MATFATRVTEPLAVIFCAQIRDRPEASGDSMAQEDLRERFVELAIRIGTDEATRLLAWVLELQKDDKPAERPSPPELRLVHIRDDDAELLRDLEHLQQLRATITTPTLRQQLEKLIHYYERFQVGH